MKEQQKETNARKFKQIHNKGIRKEKRNNILFYVIYSGILGILTFLILANKIHIHYIVDWVIICGFIFSIGYPFYIYFIKGEVSSPY